MVYCEAVRRITRRISWQVLCQLPDEEGPKKCLMADHVMEDVWSWKYETIVRVSLRELCKSGYPLVGEMVGAGSHR